MGRWRRIFFYLLATLCVSTVSFTVGVLLAFWVSSTHSWGVNLRSVTLEKVGGKDALVLSMQPHNPWEHSSFYDVSFDYEARLVDVTEMRILWNPFSPHCYERGPVIICNGLFGPESCTVRYWDGDQFVVLGEVEVEEVGFDENKLTWKGVD